MALAVGASLHLSRSISKPIQAVTDGARPLARGELDQIVPAASRDELGELANAFNEMARTLREYREAGSARLLRAQQTAQATIDSFPDPVIVVDPIGSVEQANRAARRLLGVAPSGQPPVPWHPAQPLKSLIGDVLASRATTCRWASIRQSRSPTADRSATSCLASSRSAPSAMK